MAQLESIDVKCPLCGQQFAAPPGDAGGRVRCPHCHGEVKVAGVSRSVSDDADWLQLDGDLPATAPVLHPTSEAIRGAPSLPDSFDAAADPFDIPDLPPLPSRPAMPIPTLSEEDLDALSGYSIDQDQQPAPVKVVQEAPSDTFRVKCPTCESLTYARVAQVGKKIRCGDCHSTIVVPPPPKAKTKYVPDIESTKAFTFQDGDNTGEHPKPADPFRKSADDYLRDAEASMETAPDDDWTVPSLTEWFGGVFGIFRDPAVIVYWLGLTALAAFPAGIAIHYESSIVVMGLFAGGLLFAAITIAHGFAILQAAANGERRVSEWPNVDLWEWLGPLFVAMCAAAVSAGPVWFITQYFWGNSLMTVALTMLSLYFLYPFVLLSMLDEQSVFTPFSVDVSKSVTRSAEQWGGLYLSSAIVFFATFLIFMVASTMSPVASATVSIAVSVAAVFIYFGLIGKLAYSIGQAINAPPMVNDVKRSPKMPP
ncbi:MAG: hypothetical protein ACO1RT_16790 [Planctomycetaceae bacterium]